MTSLTGLVHEEGTTTGVAGATLRGYRTMLWLARGLKAYADHDTASAEVGRLDPGTYPALSLSIGPTKGSDYVRVAAPALHGGAAWVCSRWRVTHYALLFDERLPTTGSVSGADGTFAVEVPDGDPDGQLFRLRASHEQHRDGESVRGYAALDFGVPVVPATPTVAEAGLVGLLHHFAGWTYTPSGQDSRYPYPIGVASLKIGTRPRTAYDDCCTFVEALLVRGWTDAAVPGFGWDKAKHDRAMVSSMDQRFSPVEVLQDNGMADPLDADAPPPPWTAVQVWRWGKDKGGKPVERGHTLIIVDRHAETGRLLTLEANMAMGLNGPGMRYVGGVDAFLGRLYRCPTDGFLYDPAVGDPAHGVPPGSPFLAASLWDLVTAAPVPDDWICPGCGTAKALFLPFCRPPLDWWKSPTLQTWDAFKVMYPQRKLAQLRIREMTWVR